MIKKAALVTTIVAALGAQAAYAGKPFVKVQDLNPEEHLGSDLYNDEQLSLNRDQSCETCHSLNAMPVKEGKGKPVVQQSASFVDPDNFKNGTPVSDGSVPGALGGLNAPSAGYAAFSPEFHWDDAEGLFFGGQFWNGRAALLRDQAKGPFTNPVEMAMPDRPSVIARLQENPDYLAQFISVYGIDLAAVQTDGTDPAGVQAAYHAMSLAIEAFERSTVFNRFNSKFDFVETGWTEYTASEERGADLFDAVCANCHEGTREDADGNLIQGVMTDFSYDNIGVPENVNIAAGIQPALEGNAMVTALGGEPAAEEGKQKVMSLRNIEITAPYMHNGVLLTLEQVVHFYNTRDIKPRVCDDNNDPGFGIDCWPVSELTNNVNVDELGNLGLSAQDEADIVAYLKTFTDGYPGTGDPAVPAGSEPGYMYLPSEIMPARPAPEVGSDR
jgi:cytochrome c peroxidase